MCSKAHFPSSSVKLSWNGIVGHVLIFFSFGDEEPFVNQVSSNGLRIFNYIFPDINYSIARFKKIELLKYYIGHNPAFKESFPTFIKTTKKSYDRNFCAQWLFIDLVEGYPCIEDYLNLLQAVHEDESTWLTLYRYGCWWSNDQRIMCKCSESPPMSQLLFNRNDLYNERLAECKPNAMRIEYNVRFENTLHVNATTESNITYLYMDEDSVQIHKLTQLHALTISDLLAQIGGFLGLFIGASIISLFELVEFLSLSAIRRMERLVVT